MSGAGIKTVLSGIFLFAVFSVSSMEAAPLRFFREIFPDITREQMRAVFSETGLKNNFTKHENPIITPARNSGVDLLSAVLEKTPTVLIEALIMVPYSKRTLSILDAYNAIGKIRNISNYTIYSPSRNGNIPLFEESTRLDRGRRTRPIPDPPPATKLPSSETVYICLKDTFFGSTYFRGDLSIDRYGINYNLTNNAAIWFLVFPVMRAEKFSTVLYIEPLAEGMLVYGMAGIDIPEFLVARINLAFQIDRRVTILINWIKDGLRSTD